MGSDENDAGKGQGSIGQSGPVDPPAADGDKGQRTEEDNKRYENQNIRRALHFSCIGGIQRLRHLIIYSHLKKNAIADTCSEECIGEDCHRLTLPRRTAGSSNSSGSSNSAE